MISAQACTISAAPFQVKRSRTATSSSSLRKSRARMRSAVMTGPLLRMKFGVRVRRRGEAARRRCGSRGRPARPATRSISLRSLSGERPIANPSTITPMATAQNRREDASGSRSAAPAMALDLAGIGARALGVQPLDGALDQRREILPAPRQGQRFGKEGHRVRAVDGFGQRTGVVPRRLGRAARPARRRAPDRACRGRRPRRTALPWCGSNR